MGKLKGLLEKLHNRKNKRHSTHDLVVENRGGPFTTDLDSIWEEQKKSRPLSTGVVLKKVPIKVLFNRPKQAAPPRFRTSKTLKAMSTYAATLSDDQQHCMATKLRTSQTSKASSEFKLDGDVLFYLMDFLDYPSIVSLKISCKQLHSAISISHLKPSHLEKSIVLNYFKSSKILEGQRFPQHLCQECMMWHSFEYMVLWPNPKPESSFQDINEFRNATPRKCVRRALQVNDWHPLAFSVAEWEPGKPIGKNYTLCTYCSTPKSSSTGECAWNCQICDGCTDRDNWSAYCSLCSSTKEESYQDYIDRLDSSKAEKKESFEPEEKKTAEKKTGAGRDITICGSCGHYLFQIPGISRKDVCRCGHASISAEGQHGTWLVYLPGTTQPLDLEVKTDSARESQIGGAVVNNIAISNETATTETTEEKEKITAPKTWASLIKSSIPSAPARETCPTCFQYKQTGPEISFSPNMCHCSDSVRLGVTKPTTTTQQQQQQQHQQQSSSTTSTSRQTCRNCGLFSNITPGVTLLCKLCSCPGGPRYIQKNRRPSFDRRSSWCSTCYEDFINPALGNSAPGNCKCIVTNNNNKIPLPATNTTLPTSNLTRRPVASKMNSSNTSNLQQRERCATCGGFSNITPGVTMVLEMCDCLGGPLSIKWPVFGNRRPVPSLTLKEFLTKRTRV